MNLRVRILGIAAATLPGLIFGFSNACSSASGPLEIKAGGAITGTFDDNITFRKKNEKKDLVTNLAAGLGIKYEGKTRILELAGNINQQIFAENRDFNNISGNILVNFQNEFSKYHRMSLRNMLTRTYEPRSFEEAFGRKPGRYSYYRNQFNLDYSIDVSKQLSLITRYGHEVNEISSEDLTDSILNRISFDAEYSLSSATVVLLSCGFADREFEGTGSISTRRIAAGIRQYMTKQLIFDCKTGVDFIDSYTDSSFTRPHIFIRLTDEINERTTATLSFAREYQASSYTESLFDYWQISTSFTRQLLERLSFSFSSFSGKGEYLSLDTTDNFRGASVTLTYDLKQNLKGNLTYTRSDLDSTTGTREYTKNTVYLGLNTEF
jgi:hypothetical protein